MIVLILNVFMIVVTARAMEVLSQNTQREIGQRPVLFLGLKCTPPRSKKTADLV
jgi:hypothetical protein